MAKKNKTDDKAVKAAKVEPSNVLENDGRKPVVRKEPETSFDERTSGVNQPWLNEDGSQNVG